MRQGFKAAILQLGHDPDFLVLTGDHGYGLFDEFREHFPSQFINVGVAEANMVGIAAGLARANFRPLIYGLASFIPGRVYEFLKLQIGLDGLPVVAVGEGGGLVYSTLGHSHQALDDLSLATALPNFAVFSPSSDSEVFEVLTSSVRTFGPTYIRLGKSDQGLKVGFPEGAVAPYLVFSSERASRAILSHGAMTSKMAELAESGLLERVDVWSFPAISPIESSWLQNLMVYDKVVVVEEHIEHGGLASAILRHPDGKRVPLSWVGASNKLHTRVGSYAWALAQHQLDNESLVDRVNSAFTLFKT